VRRDGAPILIAMSFPTLLEELAWRGLHHQHTDGAEPALASGSVTAYVGFDPTGSSLHVGHLVPVMGLVHLQRWGHRPIMLVGGGTGMIGDPSGRSAERNLITLDEVAANAEFIRAQLAKFLDFDGPHAARMRNNADWLLGVHLVDFLRDVGKHFTVNYMLQKDSVKSRMDSGISYTEFSYMLLQAYDFLQLFEREGCTMQLGGSDQWGNITAGIELVRRSLGAEAHAITLPLVTTADGKKFGKTAEGTSVWLDPARTSPYRFYQFWINADDRDAAKYLRMFTLLPREEIEALERELVERPESRTAQQALAVDVTQRVHGEEAARLAVEVSRVIFDRRIDPHSLTLPVLQTLSTEIPFVDLPGDPGQGTRELAVLDALVQVGLCKSKGEARRVLQQGGISLNGTKLGADEQAVPRERALHGGYFLVRKGAREIALVRLGHQPT
jgi:tyrosyl-tRNA synthetase